jgi:O-antigen/teichoic acid export membrane protein
MSDGERKPIPAPAPGAARGDPKPVEPDVLDTGAAGGRAIRGGAFRTIAYAAVMLMSVASVPFMIRHLGVVDYGRFITVSAIIFIIGSVTEAGLTNLGVREYSVLEREARAGMLGNLAGLRLALTVAGLAIALGVTAATGAERVVVEGILLMGIGLLILLMQQTYTIPLQSELRFGWISLLEVLKQLVMTAAILALVIAGAELLPFFAVTILSGLVGLVATLALLRRQGSLLPAGDLRAWRRLLRETLPFAVAVAVGIIYFRLAVVLMSYIATDEETGYYSVAFRIVEVVAVLPWIVVSTGFPILARAARNDADRLRYALQRLFHVSAIVGVGIALGLAVGAEFAIDVIAGPGFDPSVPVLRVLSLALVTSFLVATWSFALLSLRIYRALLVSNAIAAGVAVVGTLALVPLIDAEGAAVATVGAEATLAVACAAGLSRARPDLRPVLDFVPRLALALSAALVPALLLPLPSVALAALAGATYLVALLAVRGIPPEVFSALRGREPEPDPDVS